MSDSGRRTTLSSNAEDRTVRLLSVGAAHGLVRLVRADFESGTELMISDEYDTAGVTSAKLRGGVAADVAILSRVAVDDLGHEGVILASTAADLGRAAASIATKLNRGPLNITSEDDLRAALLGAPALFVPDVRTSTAGRHFLWVLAVLGIAKAVEAKLIIGANASATARALVTSGMPDALGFTQSTEILGIPELRLAAALPGRLALETVYTAAVVATARSKDGAQALVRHLTGPETRESRTSAGFKPMDRVPTPPP